MAYLSTRGTDVLMSFLSPLFLLGALAAAVPIVLHLLKREPDARVRFSAVRLLRNAPVEHASRRHLRELLLLALRVAGADPAGVRVRASVLCVGDGRAILGADGHRARHVAQHVGARPVREGAPARERTRSAAPADLVAVVTFSRQRTDRVRSRPADRALATAAIDAAAAGAGATQLSRRP